MKQKILSHLPGDFPWQVHWFDTIDSTNDRAKAMAHQGAPHGTVLIAGCQTGGRGRLGRSFSSLAGKGIYLSVILRPACSPSQLMHLTCGTGVAMCDAVQQITGLRPGIKWVNDLVIENRKLGGILTELSADPGTGLTDYAVVGIGINCSQDPQDFPPPLRPIAISLKTATGTNPDQPRLAAAMIKSLFRLDQQLPQKEQLLSAYRQDCVTIGREVLVVRDDSKIPGVAIDIDDDGALLIRLSDGTVQTVQSGEVSVRGLYSYL